jgi:nicotinamide riboside kinase
MKLPLKTIAIVGSHSTGKTTLSYTLADHLRRQGVNAITLSESVREAPVKFNEGHTVQTTEWVALRQRLKELEAEAQGYEILVSDRSVIDSFIYHQGMDLPLDGRIGKLFRWARNHFATNYNRIIFLRPGDAPMAEDGVRSAGEEYRQKIDRIFDEFIGKSGVKGGRVVELLTRDVVAHRVRIDGESLCLENLGSQVVKRRHLGRSPSAPSELER